MRFSIAYYTMLLYITVMFKPLIPIISDTFSHIFSEEIHISTVHAKYGANHLSKELAASGNDNSANKNQNIISEEQVLIHVVTKELNYSFNVSRACKDYPAIKPYMLHSVFISKVDPPPKVF